MSGATGAATGTAGVTSDSAAEPASQEERSARGSVASEGARDAGAHEGGTVSNTRQPQPQPQSQTAGGGQAQPQGGAEQPYQPPQAYRTGGAGAGTEQAVRKPRTGASTAPRTRKARLRVARTDPWSVMKVSFLLSVALGVCTVVAVAVLWMVMDAMGVFSTVGKTISEATGSAEGGGFDLQSFLSLPRVLLFTSVIALIDVVLATALATLGSFIYNLSAGFVGGVELTLAEDE
ncbi:DUF3566 domain-containing protein [Streptomyces sp. NPDC093097]|uniref:DUF3566 domain-containing protein n=1 Tax=Streptomyces sp. NPDC093097 TaxID=3366027 RepID=UPI003829437E